jgi:polysaccharide deacetylase 2 family uncharacterized protein YibQ
MGERLELTAEQKSLLIDLRSQAEDLLRLLNRAVDLAFEEDSTALLCLDAAPQASVDVIKSMIAARRALGIYREGGEKP